MSLAAQPIGYAKGCPLLLLGGILAERFPCRVGDRLGNLSGTGEAEIERNIESADGQDEQGDDVENLRGKALFGRLISHGPLLSADVCASRRDA